MCLLDIRDVVKPPRLCNGRNDEGERENEERGGWGGGKRDPPGVRCMRERENE